MPNLSFCDLSKSFWKDKNSEKAKRALKKNHTPAKECFISRETLCLLCSSHLFSVLGHIMQDITQDIRHRNAAVSTDKGSACIPLLPCMWAPQGCSKMQFNSLLPALSIPHSQVLQQPPPQLAHALQLPLPLLLLLCPWGRWSAFCSSSDLSLSCPQSDGKSPSCFFLLTAWFWVSLRRKREEEASCRAAEGEIWPSDCESNIRLTRPF